MHSSYSVDPKLKCMSHRTGWAGRSKSTCARGSNTFGCFPDAYRRRSFYDAGLAGDQAVNDYTPITQSKPTSLLLARMRATRLIDLPNPIAGRTYHDFISAQGPKYVVPDLAVAFNTGASQDDVDSWRETMDVLVDREVPSVFTVRLPSSSPVL